MSKSCDGSQDQECKRDEILRHLLQTSRKGRQGDSVDEKDGQREADRPTRKPKKTSR